MSSESSSTGSQDSSGTFDDAEAAMTDSDSKPDAGTAPEAALEFAFGDGDRDPGPIAQALADDADALDAVAAHVALLKVLGGSIDAIGRLEALHDEATRRRGAGTGSTSNVIPIPSASARRDRAGGIPVNSRRARTVSRWVWGGVGLAMAAGLGLFMWNRTTTEAVGGAGTTLPAVALVDVRDDVPSVRVLALGDVVDSGGMGFAGSTLGPASRGYLLATGRDLQAAASRPGQEQARSLALSMADRAVADLLPDVDPAAALNRGCAALFTDQSSLDACHHGAFLYRLRRDHGSPAGDLRGRSPDARKFVAWARQFKAVDLAGPIASLEAEWAATTAPDSHVSGSHVSDKERAAWKQIGDVSRQLLEAASAP